MDNTNTEFNNESSSARLRHLRQITNEVLAQRAEPKFLKILDCVFVPYVDQAKKKIDMGVVTALRGRMDQFIFNPWPFDYKTFLELKCLHQSIQNNEPLNDGLVRGASVILLPGQFVQWIAKTDFSEMINQWVDFFATWQFNDPSTSDVTFSQSPQNLHARIESRITELRKILPDPKSEFAEGPGWDEIVHSLPPWLDIRNLGNVDGVTEMHNILSFQFYASDHDIKHFNERGSFSPYSEWDVDAFHFIRHSIPGDCWPLVPGREVPCGKVYLFSDGEFFKIGYSKDDPMQRLAACQTGNAKKLSLIASIPGSVKVEKSIHRMFRDKRIRGEWFDLTEQDIEEVFLK